jgi:hypothetical protein
MFGAGRASLATAGVLDQGANPGKVVRTVETCRIDATTYSDIAC